MGKRIVFPGEELSTAEEFEGGENTFQKQGSVFSDSVGEPEFNSRAHEVSVINKKDRKVFSPGTKVYGTVTAIRKNSAFVKVLEAYDGKQARVFTKSNATLLISMVSRDYVKDIRSELRIGDIIVAEVESIKPFGVFLRTDKAEFGVIRAYCSNCRKPLHLSHGKLMCTNCGCIEKRKLSRDYSLK